MFAPLLISLAIYASTYARKQQPAPQRRCNCTQPALNIHKNRPDISSSSGGSVADGIEEVDEERKAQNKIWCA